jgi:hypothetical protein
MGLTRFSSIDAEEHSAISPLRRLLPAAEVGRLLVDGEGDRECRWPMPLMRSISDILPSQLSRIKLESVNLK